MHGDSRVKLTVFDYYTVFFHREESTHLVTFQLIQHSETVCLTPEKFLLAFPLMSNTRLEFSKSKII